MIFVTVGTDEHDFSRLVSAMDAVARTRVVVMQIGHTRYEPRHAQWFRFETNAVIDRLYREADIIVTHAGAGSIIQALAHGKIPVVVPRQKKYGEHINDHQYDLAQAMSRRGKAVLATIEELPSLTTPRRTAQQTLIAAERVLLKKLDAYLQEYATTHRPLSPTEPQIPETEKGMAGVHKERV